jgi:hypothetical protein
MTTPVQRRITTVTGSCCNNILIMQKTINIYYDCNNNIEYGDINNDNCHLLYRFHYSLSRTEWLKNRKRKKYIFTLRKFLYNKNTLSGFMASTRLPSSALPSVKITITAFWPSLRSSGVRRRIFSVTKKNKKKIKWKKKWKKKKREIGNYD